MILLLFDDVYKPFLVVGIAYFNCTPLKDKILKYNKKLY